VAGRRVGALKVGALKVAALKVAALTRHAPRTMAHRVGVADAVVGVDELATAMAVRPIANSLRATVGVIVEATASGAMNHDMTAASARMSRVTIAKTIRSRPLVATPGVAMTATRDGLMRPMVMAALMEKSAVAGVGVAVAVVAVASVMVMRL
jgi:hypothetical protein